MKRNFSVVPKLLTENPELAALAFKAFAKMRSSKIFDRNFNTGISKQIALVYFRITPLCNLRCKMCGQRGDKGVLKGRFAADEAKTIVPIEIYKNMIDEIKDTKPVLYFWGGEPFLYPDFMELAKYAVESGCLFSVNTNGTFLAKRAEQIVRDGWHVIFVSLDGFEEVNDNIRGKGSYQRVVEGFKAIKYEKERQGKKLPMMGVVTTVSNLNYEYLDELTQAAQDFGLTLHIINLGTYTTDEVVKIHKREYQEKLGVESHCLEAYSTGYNENINGDKFCEILEKVHAQKPGYPIITIPAINPKKIGEYYAHPENVVRTDCPIPWCQANVDYNGNVHFCADYNEYVIGNLKEEPFLDIFNSERAQKFRKALKDSPDGLFRGCLRCYQNMLFGKKKRGY